jgi:hypothetical protein
VVQPGRTSPASYTTSWVRSREPGLTMWRRRDATPPPGSELSDHRMEQPFHAGSSDALPRCCGAPGAFAGCPARARGGRAGQRRFFPSGIPCQGDSRRNDPRTLAPSSADPCRVQNTRPNPTESRLPGTASSCLSDAVCTRACLLALGAGCPSEAAVRRPRAPIRAGA